MLDEELAARALFKNLRLQLTGSVELVIAREYDASLFSSSRHAG